MPAPGDKVSSLRPRRISQNCFPPFLKISYDLFYFSHRPILHQALQHTDFSPPIHLNSRSSSFCAPFTNFTKKIYFSFTLFTQRLTQFSVFCAPLLGSARGGRPPLPPSYAT